MRLPLSFAALLVAVTLPTAAGAQPPPQPPLQPGAKPEPTPTKPVEIPPPPVVDDPMLQPVAPPVRTIASWDEALVYIRARSTDLRIATLEVKRAEAQSRVALAGALTTINGQANYTHHFITETTPPQTATNPQTGQTIVISNGNTVPRADAVNAALTLSQPIVNVAAWYNIGTAHRSEDLARISIEDLKRTIALSVANAIVSVVTSERVAELNRLGLRRALERFQLTQRKKDLGAANGLDVIRVRQDVEVARATLVSGDESLRQSREALGLALGMPVQIGVAKGITIDGIATSALQACQRTGTIEERADLLAAKKRVEVAHRNVRAVDTQFLPTLTAQSALATTTAFTFASPATTWSISAVLAVPIREGGARYGNKRSASVLEAQALENLEALRRRATIEVAQAQRGVEVAEQSRKVAADARALAEETDRLTRIGYQEGQGTSLEIVVAAGGLRQAEITLALREFDLVRARVLAALALSTCSY